MKKEVLFFIHGYMSIKEDMSLLEEAFQNQDYILHNAEIIGHDNASSEDFMLYFWDDWFKSVEKQFLEYKNKGYEINLIGHSMGGLLALALTQKYQECVKSIATLSTPIYINRYYPLEITNKLCFLAPLTKSFIPKIAKSTLTGKKSANVQETYYYPPQLDSLFVAMREVRRNLHIIHAPILALQAFDDKTVPDSNPFEITKRVSSKKKTLKMYTIEDPKSKKHQIINHPETYEKVIADIREFLESK